MKSKLSCPICRRALTCNENLEDTYRSDFGLIDKKDRGGVVRPSDDVIAVRKSAERCMRMYTGTGQRPMYTWCQMQASLLRCELLRYVRVSLREI